MDVGNKVQRITMHNAHTMDIHTRPFSMVELRLNRIRRIVDGPSRLVQRFNSTEAGPIYTPSTHRCLCCHGKTPRIRSTQKSNSISTRAENQLFGQRHRPRIGFCRRVAGQQRGRIGRKWRRAEETADRNLLCPPV